MDDPNKFDHSKPVSIAFKLHQCQDRVSLLRVKIEQLHAALQEYGQHQSKACLELPAAEKQFCYCGLTAALAGIPDETKP